MSGTAHPQRDEIIEWVKNNYTQFKTIKSCLVYVLNNFSTDPKKPLSKYSTYKWIIDANVFPKDLKKSNALKQRVLNKPINTIPISEILKQYNTLKNSAYVNLKSKLSNYILESNLLYQDINDVYQSFQMENCDQILKEICKEIEIPELWKRIIDIKS